MLPGRRRPDLQVGPPDPDLLRILVATDNHLGVHEADDRRKHDSFETFEEIFDIAEREGVDAVLLGGDLFHDARPSQRTLVRCIDTLRRRVVGERVPEVRGLNADWSAYADSRPPNFGPGRNPRVSLPVFTIHGNHDDPSAGEPSIGAVDILAATGLVNYFGKHRIGDGGGSGGSGGRGGAAGGGSGVGEGGGVSSGSAPGTGKVRLKPILLAKGRTQFAMWGLGNLRDERMARLFGTPGCVEWSRPPDTPRYPKESWLNVCVLHQNRRQHSLGAKNFLDERAIPRFFDLVVWGHEHECLPKPERSPAPDRSFFVLQPGSSVATALSEGESKPKHVVVLEVRGTQWRTIEHPLRTVRPFAYEEISLAAEAGAAARRALRAPPGGGGQTAGDSAAGPSVGISTAALAAACDLAAMRLDPGDPKTVADYLTARLRKAAAGLVLPPDSRAPGPPLVRLRVDYSGFPTVHTQRLSQRFIGTVANPRDVVLWQKPAARRAGGARAPDAALGDRGPAAVPSRGSGGGARHPQEGEKTVEELVDEHLTESLSLLPPDELAEALRSFVDREDRQALADAVTRAIGETTQAAGEDAALDGGIQAAAGRARELAAREGEGGGDAGLAGDAGATDADPGHGGDGDAGDGGGDALSAARRTPTTLGSATTSGPRAGSLFASQGRGGPSTAALLAISNPAAAKKAAPGTEDVDALTVVMAASLSRRRASAKAHSGQGAGEEGAPPRVATRATQAPPLPPLQRSTRRPARAPSPAPPPTLGGPALALALTAASPAPARGTPAGGRVPSVLDLLGVGPSSSGPAPPKAEGGMTESPDAAEPMAETSPEPPPSSLPESVPDSLPEVREVERHRTTSTAETSDAAATPTPGRPSPGGGRWNASGSTKIARGRAAASPSAAAAPRNNLAASGAPAEAGAPSRARKRRAPAPEPPLAPSVVGSDSEDGDAGRPPAVPSSSRPGTLLPSQAARGWGAASHGGMAEREAPARPSGRRRAEDGGGAASVEELVELAREGRWREVASRCREVPDGASRPVPTLSLAGFRALSFAKLGLLSEAQAVIESAGCGNAWQDRGRDAGEGATSGGDDAAAERATGGDEDQDSIPYVLRWLSARLPGLAGDETASADRLRALARLCDARAASGAGGPGGGRRWARRRARASLEAACAQAILGRPRAALRELGWLLGRDPGCSAAWRHLGYVQLLIGDVSGAELSLRKADGAEQETAGGAEGTGHPAPPPLATSLFPVSPGPERPPRSASEDRAAAAAEVAAARDRALLLVSRRNFAAASLEYASVLASGRLDPAAVANHALSLLYQRSLDRAVGALETAFRRERDRAAAQALVREEAEAQGRISGTSRAGDAEGAAGLRGAPGAEPHGGPRADEVAEADEADVAPTTLLLEPLVHSLASMYDLGGTGQMQRAKREFAAWVAQVAPDDFDLASTKVT